VLRQDSENRFIAGPDLSHINPMISIRVWDNGPGLTGRPLRKYLKCLSQPRLQAWNRLGLTIVKRLIEAANGLFTCTPRPTRNHLHRLPA